MERLTRRSDTGHAYYPRCFEEPCGGDGCKIKDCLFDNTICERLAKYEDTGLEPDEVTPVVHGRWDIMDGYKARRACSVCGWDVPEYGKFYSYCPNCGAKMDLEVE